jgi:1,4-alpha-glucan branching enzyme
MTGAGATGRPAPDLDALAEDLAAWLPRQRWFAGKDRGLRSVAITDFAGLGARLVLILAEATHDDGTSQRYQVPLAALPVGVAAPGDVVTRAGGYAFIDAAADDEASRQLAVLTASARTVPTAAGASVAGEPVEALPPPGRARLLGVEQSNTSVVLGERLILKLLRRLEAGENPEVELTRALTRRGTAHAPALHGALTLTEGDRHTTLAVLSDFVAGGREGWSLVVTEAEAIAAGRQPAAPVSGAIRDLGAAVADVHAALAHGLGSRPATRGDLERMVGDMRAQLDRVLGAAQRRAPAAAEAVLAVRDDVADALGDALRVTDPGPLIRVHGDLHLGQAVLDAQGVWQVLDFEGEPARPLEQRRAPASPLRDVAGMLRSFDYAVGYAVRGGADEAVLAGWRDELREAFLSGYLPPARAAGLLPADEASLRMLLAALEAEKAVYEVGYELANRPDWIGIPVGGILRVLDARESLAWQAPRDEVDALLAGRHADPHRLLGVHPSGDGAVVRAYRPNAEAITVVVAGGAQVAAVETADGFFEALLETQPAASAYRLRVSYPGQKEYEFHDAYAFWPTLGELDVYLAGEGRHSELWQRMGSHVTRNEGIGGASFAVWAPNARGVRVVGDFNSWDGRLHPMRRLGSSGIWELFVPDVGPGTLYQYEMVTADGRLVTKADPYAQSCEMPPGRASRVYESAYTWGDAEWMDGRGGQPATSPLSIYEVHLGSWRHRTTGGPLSYRELADALISHLSYLGFNFVEFLPVAEHPFGGSWGYQVTGYYAPTARYGDPDDFRYLVDRLHQAGIGVIVDWVPAHFPRDDWALARFDGTALYEHADPRQGEHPDWGTLVFNFGRNEVRNFLIANALYWLEELHVDGLRVDAVASMLYLDYSRKDGEWVPNRYGGRENLEAIDFLRDLNREVYGRNPHALMIAEESTPWPGVSRPVHLGGLGFGFKWNMGWMHDTLDYFSRESIHRRYHHNQLSFGLLYAFTENFVLPVSHDEVVHGKRALLDKMPGDRWQKFANLRSLYAYMWAHPGKQLLFMGCEFGQWREWDDERQLDWYLLDEPDHAGLRALVAELNSVYRSLPSLWQRDSEGSGFEWIDANDADDNVLAFLRRGEPGTPEVACVGNFSPVVRRLRVGLSQPGTWREALNTDASVYGGSGVGNLGSVEAEPVGWHGLPASAEVTLPPLATLWLVGP